MLDFSQETPLCSCCLSSPQKTLVTHQMPGKGEVLLAMEPSSLKICFFSWLSLAATLAHALTSKTLLSRYLCLLKLTVQVFLQLWKNCWASLKRILKGEAAKPPGSPGNGFLLWIHNLKCPQVLADIQGTMQEACMCKHAHSWWKNKHRIT